MKKMQDKRIIKVLDIRKKNKKETYKKSLFLFTFCVRNNLLFVWKHNLEKSSFDHYNCFIVFVS